jgi:hypothetical protein
MRSLSVVLVAVVIALAGCGSSSKSSSSATTAAKAATTAKAAAPLTPAQVAQAKFAAAAGLAFGAFNRYIYAPLKEGKIKQPIDRALLAKGTAAAQFVARELRTATAAAKATPALSAVAPQLAVLSGGFTAALARLKAGHFNPIEINTAASAIESIKSAAAAAGVKIKETVPAVP